MAIKGSIRECWSGFWPHKIKFCVAENHFKVKVCPQNGDFLLIYGLNINYIVLNSKRHFLT